VIDKVAILNLEKGNCFTIFEEQGVISYADLLSQVFRPDLFSFSTSSSSAS
jgi:hypothetical protein